MGKILLQSQQVIVKEVGVLIFGHFFGLIALILGLLMDEFLLNKLVVVLGIVTSL